MLLHQHARGQCLLGIAGQDGDAGLAEDRAGVEVRRIGIAETIQATRAFLTAALARIPMLESPRP